MVAVTQPRGEGGSDLSVWFCCWRDVERFEKYSGGGEAAGVGLAGGVGVR